MRRVGSTILLAALAFAGTAAAQSVAKRHAITSASAVGDGQTPNTGAIQALIDRVAQQGGGILVVPKGTAQKGFVIENARKVDLSGLTLEVKKGEPVTTKNLQ